MNQKSNDMVSKVQEGIKKGLADLFAKENLAKQNIAVDNLEDKGSSPVIAPKNPLLEKLGQSLRT